MTWRKKPVKLTWKGRAFYEKVVWLQIQKSCSIGSAALGTDRAEIAGKYQVHPNQVQQWKKKHMEGASEICHSKAERTESKLYTEDDLMRKIERLEIEKDLLRSVSLACGLNLEKAQISDQKPALSVNRQLKLLQVPHLSFYYKSQRENFPTAPDERVKNKMMEIYMETPFYGVPRLTAD